MSYKNTVLLMHFDGENNSTNFIDETGKTITRFGDTKISTNQSVFGGSSGYFDGNGDYLSVPNSSDFDFVSGDFTIEFWIYPQNTSGVVSLIHKGWPSTYPPFLIYLSGGVSTNSISFFASGDDSSWNVANELGSGYNLSNSTWNHVAVVRNGQNFKFYVNGQCNNAGTNSSDVLTVNTQNVRIGNATNEDDNFLGYIDELRISKGIARYIEDFTPPNKPFYFPKVFIPPIGFEKSVKTIKGIIRDKNGEPCQRLVYAVTRLLDNNQLEILDQNLSDPITGEYELTYKDYGYGEVSRVVVSENDEAPLLNDIIDRIKFD